MGINKKEFKATNFDEFLANELKDPEFKKWYDYYGIQLEVAYNILQLRKKKNMSQADLARKIGTTQSNVARLEGGQQNFTVCLLDKVAEALGADLKISFQ
jgi:ribosome-binding protein aMBF1 (putative translation factor)